MSNENHRISFEFIDETTASNLRNINENIAKGAPKAPVVNLTAPSLPQQNFWGNVSKNLILGLGVSGFGKIRGLRRAEGTRATSVLSELGNSKNKTILEKISSGVTNSLNKAKLPEAFGKIDPLTKKSTIKSKIKSNIKKPNYDTEKSAGEVKINLPTKPYYSSPVYNKEASSALTKPNRKVTSEIENKTVEITLEDRKVTSESNFGLPDISKESLEKSLDINKKIRDYFNEIKKSPRVNELAENPYLSRVPEILFGVPLGATKKLNEFINPEIPFNLRKGKATFKPFVLEVKSNNSLIDEIKELNRNIRFDQKTGGDY